MNEEILVFSDTEFANIKRNARGANLAVMMEIPKHYNQVVKEVYNYAKVHSQVNFYDGKPTRKAVYCGFYDCKCNNNANVCHFYLVRESAE